MDFDLHLLLLIPAGFLAGAINTIAGGGSILTLPLLIFMGLPETIANGTNKIAVFFQTASATSGFKSKGINTFPFSIYLGVSASIGAFIGANYAVNIDGDVFKKILSIVMIAVVFLSAFKSKQKSLKQAIERTTGKHLYIAIIAFFFIGLYGGFLNSGNGLIILMLLPYLNKLSLVKANATKVTVICIYIFVALIVFVINDKVNWLYGLTLAVGNASGAWVASRYSVKKGDGFIRAVLFVIVIAMSIKLWFS